MGIDLKRRGGSLMSHCIDLTHQRFGRLVVEKRAKTVARNGNVCWICLCDCGSRVVVEGYALRKVSPAVVGR